MNLKVSLHNHLTHIVRIRDPYLESGGHFFVQQYIHTQLCQWGSVEIHTFNVRGKACQNLILNLPPQSSPRKANLPPILIGAHYDGVPGSPAADDNATGVAVLIELARAFYTNPCRYPLRFVAFDMEEYGLLGSADYAQHLQQAGQKLRLMMSLEMLGYCDKRPHSQNYPPPLEKFYPSTGDFIALIGNWRTWGDLIKISRTMAKIGVKSEWLPVPGTGKLIRPTRLSDHAPFWDLGYPAIMVTDTAFMRNPHYHQPSDTIETLDLDFLTGVCQGLEQAIRKI